MRRSPPRCLRYLRFKKEKSLRKDKKIPGSRFIVAVALFHRKVATGPGLGAQALLARHSPPIPGCPIRKLMVYHLEDLMRKQKRLLIPGWLAAGCWGTAERMG